MSFQETCDLIDRYVLRLMRDSTPERTAWNLEKIRQGIPTNWNYIDGCMMTALSQNPALSMKQAAGPGKQLGLQHEARSMGAVTRD